MRRSKSVAVKICGLTRAEDARAAVAAGADLIGLVFAPSPRQVTIAQAKRIVAALPPQIVRVGVFVDQDPAWIARVAGEVGLDRLQFHGREPESVLRRFPKSRVIRALRPERGAVRPRKDPAPAAACYLVDACVPGVAGGTGRLADWEFARALRRFGKPLILSGGLTAANVAQAVRRVHPEIVDVSSGVEIRPGIKSAKKMRAVIKAVKGLPR
jgi:phosphoribosylanthranilate isomerase